VAPKRKELDVPLRYLAERHDALAEIVHRLDTHAAVLAVALRDPEAVPSADLDAALAASTTSTPPSPARPAAS